MVCKCLHIKLYLIATAAVSAIWSHQGNSEYSVSKIFHLLNMSALGNIRIFLYTCV